MKNERMLTMEDFEDVKPSPGDSALQILRQVAQIAIKLLDEEKSIKDETSTTTENPVIESEMFLTSAAFCNDPIPKFATPRCKRSMRKNSTKKRNFPLVDNNLKRENWRDRLAMQESRKKTNDIGCSKWQRESEDREEEEARERKKNTKNNLFKKEEKMRGKANTKKNDCIFETNWVTNGEIFDRPVQYCTKLDISKEERMMGERSTEKHVVPPVDNNLSKEKRLMRESLLKRPIIEESSKKTKEIIFGKQGHGGDRKIEDEEEEDARGKKKPRKSKKAIDNGPEPPPDLPQPFADLIREFNGSEVKLVIQKGLYGSDLVKGENRLLMPLKQLRSVFLSDEEKAFLGTRNGKNVNGIKALLLEPCGERCELITFKKWDMKMSSNYLFNGGWNKVKERNSLEEGMVVQVWSFRREDGSLGFALVKVGEDGISSGGPSENGAGPSRSGGGPSGDTAEQSD